MTTGRTPLLDSLIAGGYVLLFVDFRNGSYWDRINNRIFTSQTGSSLKLVRSNLNSRPISAPRYTLSEQFYATSDYSFVLVGASGSNLTGTQGINSYLDTAQQCFIQFIPYCYYREKVGGTALSATQVTWLNNVKYTSVVVRKYSEGNALISFYRNGVLIGQPDRNGGPIASESGANWVVTTAYNALFWGATLIIKKALTQSEVATLTDELDNQITYETNPLIINSSYPTVGSSVYEARFGIIADERTMSAGQSIGQLDALRVVSGTHKCSTELYGNKLAKTIVCVTSGTVRLPDPRPDLGTTFAFKKYTGSTWIDATSSSKDIALTAGEKILWATNDASVCLRKY